MKGKLTQTGSIALRATFSFHLSSFIFFSSIHMKKVILIIAAALFTIPSFAQALSNRHEFSIWGGRGTSSLQYKSAPGNYEAGAGGIIGIGYHYFFNYHWSIGTGMEYSLLKESLSIPTVSDNYITPDRYSERLYWIAIDGQDYKQTQDTRYFNIPLTIKAQLPIAHGHSLYFSAGPKIGIPLKSSYSSKGAFTTTGVEVNEQRLEPLTTDWFHDMKAYGFFTDSVLSLSDYALSLKTNLILAFEAGIKWRLSSKYSLYTGIFFDYGLNDVRADDADRQFLEYNRNQPAKYNSNSLLLSQYTPLSRIPGEYTPFPAESPRPFAEKVSTMAVGIKLQLSIGGASFEKKREAGREPAGTNPVIDRPAKKAIPKQRETITETKKKAPTESPQVKPERKQKLKPEKPVSVAKNETPDFEGFVSGFTAFTDDITPEMIPFLNRKVYWLKKYPDVNLLLVGHADDAGPDSFNYLLANDRANAVKNYLVSKGIDKNRLTTTSEGKTLPAIPNATGSARAANRRVEFVLQ
jgi:outer membrane protein OmpA-like peptidoglycan-associated protein